eukprot:7390245-Prymnesium_polylepis.2
MTCPRPDIQAIPRQLQSVHKAARPAGGVEEKEAERENVITKYIARDAVMPGELMTLAIFLLGIFVYMARLPFSVVTSPHFMRFLWALRPNFAKNIVPRTLMTKVATEILDEAYEETVEIADSALAKVPGRPTLGIDGHKEGKHRHVET